MSHTQAIFYKTVRKTVASMPESVALRAWNNMVEARRLEKKMKKLARRARK